MKRMRWLSVLILVAGCGTNSQSQLTWPAQVVSIQAMSDSQTTSLRNVIKTLNTKEGKTVLGFPEDKMSGSPITVEMVASLDGDGPTNSAVCALGVASTARLDTTTQVAGRAIIDPGKCTVQLAQFLVDGDYDLFEAVAIHEFGHCAGLMHVAQTLQVMSPVTVPYSQYAADALQTFFSSFTKSAGI